MCSFIFLLRTVFPEVMLTTNLTMKMLDYFNLFLGVKSNPPARLLQPYYQKTILTLLATFYAIVHNSITKLIYVGDDGYCVVLRVFYVGVNGKSGNKVATC